MNKKSRLILRVLMLLVVISFISLFNSTQPVLAKKVTIEYAVWGQPYEIEMEQKYLEVFAKKYPDINVILTTAPFGPHHEKLMVRIAGRKAPDVFVLSELRVTQFIARNLLAKLDEYVEREKIDLSEFFDVCLAYMTSRGEPHAIRHREGSLYGLPTWNSPCLISVNLGMFEKAGLKVDENWDWETFLDYCKKLTKDFDGDGRIDQFGTQNILTLQAYVWTFVWANGGRWFNDEATECLVNSPESVEAYQFLTDLSTVYHVAPTKRERKGWAMAEDFVGRQVASRWSHPWGLEAWKEAPFPWTPVLPPMRKGKRVVEFETCTVGMYRETKHPEESWTLVKYLGTDPDCLRIMLDYSVAPALKVWSKKAEDPKMRKFIESMEYGVAPGFIAEWPEAEEILNSELDLVLEEKVSVKEALDRAKRRIDELLWE